MTVLVRFSQIVSKDLEKKNFLVLQLSVGNVEMVNNFGFFTSYITTNNTSFVKIEFALSEF